MDGTVISTELSGALPDIEISLDTPSSGESRNRSVMVTFYTTPITGISDPFTITQDMTMLTEEENLSDSITPGEPPEVDNSIEDPATSLNRTRIELLARQYAAQSFPIEHEARLAIVSEQVERLIPRATAKDFEALSEILEEVDTIKAEAQERRRRLSIE